MDVKKNANEATTFQPLKTKKAPQMRGLLYAILVKYYFNVAGQGLPALDFTATVPNSP